MAFPNSMVDRITPVTTDDDRDEVRKRFGVDDAWPVVCEPFTQWALEDAFPLGRPPFEDAGVQVVADVEPYELMKLRLLNASHQALCYFGYLAGYRLVHDVAQDPLFAELPAGLHGPRGHPDPGAGAGHRPATSTSTSSSTASPTPRSRTPWPGCARKARTASRSGCSR